MKRVLFTRVLLTSVSLAVLGLIAPALGADLPAYKAPVRVSPDYDWSGFYIGVFGGGGFGNHNINYPGVPTGFANAALTYDSTGAVAGGEVGYNAQSGRYLVGIEATGLWSGIKGSDTSQAAAQALGLSDADNLRKVATVVGRGGIAVDRLLLFFTGGWAYGDILHTNNFTGFGVDQFAVTRSGLTAGGGIAYALTENISTKFEYRYFNFGTFSRLAPTNGLIPYSDTATYSIITLGLDFKFGGSGAVVAKY